MDVALCLRADGSELKSYPSVDNFLPQLGQALYSNVLK